MTSSKGSGICHSLPLSVLIGLLPALAGGAEIYKWTDADGKVYYSDRPAAENATAVELKKEGRDSGADPVLEQRREKQRRLLQVMEEERRGLEQDRQQQKETARQEALKRQRLCSEMRDHQRILSEQRPLYQLDETGNRIYLTDDERLLEQQRVNALLSENCRG